MGNPVYKSPQGKVALELVSIKVPKKGILEVKGIALGAMPVTIWITPEDLWATMKIVKFPVIKAVLGMLWTGWRTRKKSKS